jgi:hypothetical protein
VDDTELCRHPRVYRLAHDFGIDGLKDLCLQKFNELVREGWSSHVFPTAVLEIYNSAVPTDRPLKDIVVKTALRHIEALQKKASFQDLLRSEGDFAVDLVEKLAQR